MGTMQPEWERGMKKRKRKREGGREEGHVGEMNMEKEREKKYYY